MIIVQSNSLPLHSETFTQPCAEQRKSLVEQTEEITVKSLLENNDIQPLGNKLRFLVAPRKNSTSVGFFAYIADYQRITYAPSVVNFQTMSAQM